MAERTLVVNSISKTGRSTGWRIGWVISPPERTRRLRAVHDNLVVQAPTPLQKGAVSLLRRERAFFEGIAEGYRRKRDLLLDGLREAGFAASPPEGAYYLFADYRSVPALAEMSPTDAAMHLIRDVGVATVPGDNFYATGNEGIAICASRSAARSRRSKRGSSGCAKGYESSHRSGARSVAAHRTADRGAEAEPGHEHSTRRDSMFYELRQYKIHPGRMEEWVEFMEGKIIPFQVSRGMVITGSWRGEEDETVYVWMRRFDSEAERERLYEAVYQSDYWKNDVAPRVAELMDRSAIRVTRIVPTRSPSRSRSAASAARQPSRAVRLRGAARPLRRAQPRCSKVRATALSHPRTSRSRSWPDIRGVNSASRAQPAPMSSMDRNTPAWSPAR